LLYLLLKIEVFPSLSMTCRGLDVNLLLFLTLAPDTDEWSTLILEEVSFFCELFSEVLHFVTCKSTYSHFILLGSE
jgi:hypothetical protein